MKMLFAIAGCGRIAQRHAEQIAEVGKLAAVCDIVPEKADQLAALYGAEAFYSIEDMLQKGPKTDVVSICTPNGLHADHSIQCLRAGTHVLCEKPLCIHSADGRHMILEAEKAKRKLFVVKQNRYNPPVAFLKELLMQGKLGKIFSFQVNCFWNRPAEYYAGWKGTKDLDGGTLYTQFSHFIDILYWLLGDVADVKVMTENFSLSAIEFEDTGAVLFKMKNGTIGTLNYTVNSFEKNMEGSFTVFGEKGTVKIGGQYLNELEYFNVKDMPVPDLPKGNPANGYGFYRGSMSNHDKVYQNLAAAIENDVHALAGAEEGLKTVEIIERIYSKS